MINTIELKPCPKCQADKASWGYINFHDDEEWAKFRFLVKDYRRAGKALTAAKAYLGDG